jgi:uncharacterized protein YfaP (DUF2135 family)
MSRRLLVLGVLAAAFASSAPAPASPVEGPGRIRILAPRGGQTRDRVVAIRGTAVGVSAPRLTLVLNGVPLSIANDSGSFATEQVLAPGLNTIRVAAQDGAAVVQDEVALYARVPAKDLRVTLTWDTDHTDVDLWVTGPDGEKVFYQKKQGAQGGTLDTDVTSGYGPETYTQARLVPGAYRIEAHYYGGALPTRVVANVIRGEGTPEEERREFRAVLLEAGDVVVVGEFHVSR